MLENYVLFVCLYTKVYTIVYLLYIKTPELTLELIHGVLFISYFLASTISSATFAGTTS